MKILHVSYSDSDGAGRAAGRLHAALRAAAVESNMLVMRHRTGAANIKGPGATGRFLAKVRSGLGQKALKLQSPVDTGFRSPAFLPSRLPERLAREAPDVTHLHWVNAQMMTPADIARLRGPVVWTLHDMWAFSGTEHYPGTDRWQHGYSRANRPAGHRGLDLDRWTWRQKQRAWTRPIQLVCPSTWLADCVRRSHLMADWPVAVIPNAIDARIWHPMDKAAARAQLDLPENARVVLFGATGGVDDPRKGGDLMGQVLGHLTRLRSNIHFAVFGQSEGPDLGAPTHYLGRLETDAALRAAYAAADVFALPSRRDNLPNTGVEAQSCGTPVVAFGIGGVPDIVSHRETGYLAAPYSTEDFARGIAWVLESDARHSALSRQAFRHARQKFDGPVVAAQHLDLYRSHLEEVHP